MPSGFPEEDPNARTVVGRVLAGTEVVPGALVRVDIHPGFATDAHLAATAPATDLFARSQSTNPAGAYRFAFAPIAYDLSIRADNQLMVFRELNVRYFDAPIGIEATPTGFSAGVIPTTDPPTRGGNAVAYFVSGPDARTLSNGTGTLTAKFRRFESTITLHAVEYVATRGPAAAMAAGQIDVVVRDGTIVTPIIPMILVASTQKVVFDATAPTGYAMDPLSVEMDLGLRTSAVPVARVMPGEPLEISVVVGARYAVRGRATQGGAVSSSGWFVFDPFGGKIPLQFPGPISGEAPIDDDAISTGMATNTLGPTTLEAGGVLAARLGQGVVEHVLTPDSGNGGPVVRVATGSRTTTLPDATEFGFARPVGHYLWTFQHFPKLPRIDYLVGEDGRMVPASWTSAPRAIVLR